MTLPETSEIEELPGAAKMYGSDMMREPQWKWSQGPPDYAYMIRTAGGEAVSILRLFKRMLKNKKRHFRTLGIGGVWTRPDLRERGYAAVLLAKTVALLRDEQPSADLIVLYSTPRSLYANLGFLFEVADGLLAFPLHKDVLLPPNKEWHIDPEGHF